MASTPAARTKNPTIKRIRKSSPWLTGESGNSTNIPPVKEAAELSNAPSADYAAWPLETDLFEWHFTFRGPPNSPYSDGLYHGRIILPANYPLAPPNFRFSTPNGRFEANREICLSISGHHEETWQPAWGIRTAVVALRSFMETDAKGQVGGLDTTDNARRMFAKESLGWKCATCGRSNQDIMEESEERAKEIAASQPSEAQKEVEIPTELRLGFKDEMTAKKEDDEATAEVAEGFVQTAPVQENTPNAAQTSSSAPLPEGGDVRNRPPRPAQGVPQPTATAPSPSPREQQQPQQQPQRIHVQPTDTGVPVWIDRAIVGLVVLLGMLILKVLFGS